MKITKISHSCILIEEKDVKILIDPGNYSTAQNELKNVDAIVITHEHQDHCDPNSIKIIAANNPNAMIITNKGVGAVLDKLGLKYSIVENGQSVMIKEVKVEGFGEKHALVHSTIPLVIDTGYIIADKLYHPGDALAVPTKPIELLALPTAGPWLKISETIDFAKAIKPKTCFPIHDGSLKTPIFIYTVLPNIFSPMGIEFKQLADGASLET
jgi:L-ascorbate metabolism protein UlaG (beta-lactamase superfamily)